MATNAGIKAIQLDMDTGGGIFTVHAAVLWDEQEVVLVDTGIAGQKELIHEVLRKEGFPPEKLSKILITHQDRDHIGSLPDLAAAGEGRIQVLAHETAVPFIEGKVPLTKSGVLAVPVQVDVPLHDGQILPYAGGIQVVYTPGHTPDHTSYYHIPTRTLISGDALTAQDGVLHAFDPKFTADPETATASIRKMLDLQLDTIITYHGGVVTDDISEKLRQFAGNGQ